MKRLLLLLPALALVALLLPPTPVDAANPDWSAKLKEFKSNFKTKKPLKERRTAVKTLAKRYQAGE